uniref:RNA helicase n=1 Tax=Oncorhynchus tshawytscha TaxID=74940 RepID=A0A8C8IBZ3_ONCTS
MPSLMDSLESGLDFIEFLGERKSTMSDRKELRDIYNLEFKCREGMKDPHFSNVLYALLKFNKVRIRQGKLYFNVKPQVRVYYCDQWRRPSVRQQQDNITPQENGGAPEPFSPLLTSSSATPVDTVLTPKKRLAKEILQSLKVNRAELTSDKGGIEITSDPEMTNGKVTFSVERLQETFAVKFYISNNGASCVYFTYYTALHRIRCFTLMDERRVTRACPLFLCPGEKKSSTICLNALSNLSEFISLCSSKPFCIVREMEASARTHLAVELGPFAPFKPCQVVPYKPVDTVIVEGEPPERYSQCAACLPAGINNCLDPILPRLIAPVLEVRKENRPSVLRGDCLKVAKSEDKVQPITVYTGYVHRVELERVKLGFSKRLVQSFISNTRFDVEFTINRFPLKLQHRAVDLAEKHQMDEVLFPSGSGVQTTHMPKLSMFNRQLENNPEQHAAIQRIVSGASKPAPYLVFGPPGTGKTITLVEAMNQLNRVDPLCHILACAPSNSASDLLCERLLGHMDPHCVYRLYASSRPLSTVPQNLLKHCNWDASQDSFVFPTKEVLMGYKVIITTLVTAGRLVSGGIPVGHFTHVFIDESGQAVEPESIIGIAGLLHPEEGQLVLAGDPQQLGPVLRSPLAMQYGMGISLLERLMKDNPLYQKDGEFGHFDSRFVTKLLRNYRSHPAILKIPNELFYEKELQVFADQWDRETYCNWEHLPKEGFPLIFHGVLGKDEREGNSPSFFNVSEIEVLMDYLTKLMKTQGKKGLPKLSPKDIGIIAPYRKQVEKIQKALNFVKELSQWKDIKELKVGSVEEFQGQERKIIMVSTVRSSINYVKMDQDFNIGFLTNEKRFNVAMTRAKALLIVVGNPGQGNYCVEEQGYTGFDFTDAEGEEDVVTRLASLKITQYVHPEWRTEQ